MLLCPVANSLSNYRIHCHVTTWTTISNTHTYTHTHTHKPCHTRLNTHSQTHAHTRTCTHIYRRTKTHAYINKCIQTCPQVLAGPTRWPIQDRVTRFLSSAPEHFYTQLTQTRRMLYILMFRSCGWGVFRCCLFSCCHFAAITGENIQISSPRIRS